MVGEMSVRVWEVGCRSACQHVVSVCKQNPLAGVKPEKRSGNSGSAEKKNLGRSLPEIVCQVKNVRHPTSNSALLTFWNAIKSAALPTAREKVPLWRPSGPRHAKHRPRLPNTAHLCAREQVTIRVVGGRGLGLPCRPLWYAGAKASSLGRRGAGGVLLGLLLLGGAPESKALRAAQQRKVGEGNSTRCSAPPSACQGPVAVTLHHSGTMAATKKALANEPGMDSAVVLPIGRIRLFSN